MSTVDDAADASALALAKLYEKRVPHKADELASDAVLQAAWPVLSAGLRELHVEREWRPLDGTCLGGTVCNHCRRDWPCATVRELDRIDRELGIDHQPGTERAVPCPAHRPVQHRDARPPWCNACGLTEGGEVPTGPLDHRNRS